MTRESEWDDHERDKMLALDQYESELCDCGLHRSVADTDPRLRVETPVCPACANLAQWLRGLNASDDEVMKHLGKNPPPSAARPDDGRRIHLVPVDPDPSEAGD